jgi:hypothetical protein
MKHVISRLVLPALTALPLLLAGAAASASVINVDNTIDPPVAGDNKCSLGEAIKAVNTRSAVDKCPKPDGNDDTITLPAGTINLHSTQELTIVPADGSNNITFVGRGYLKTIINGAALPNAGGSMFHVNDEVSANFFGLTLGNADTDRNVNSGASRRAVWVEAQGGLWLQNVRIMNTNAGGGSAGGCINNLGSAYLQNVALIHCKSGNSGGALTNTGSATLISVTIDGEDPMHRESAVGTDVRVNSEHGGGINNTGTGFMYIGSSTLTRLVGRGAGAAIHNSGVLSIRGSTIAHNHTQDDGAAINNTSGAQLDILGSIVINNANRNGNGNFDSAGGMNCGGATITSDGFNIFGSFNSSGVATNTCTNVTAPPAGTFDRIGAWKTLQFTQTPGSSSVLGAPVHSGGVGDVFLPEFNFSLVPVNRSAHLMVPAATDSGFCNDLDQREILRARVGAHSCDVGAAARTDALFVAVNASALNSGETFIRNRMTALGYQILTVSQTDSPARFAPGRFVALSPSLDPNVILDSFADTQSAVLVTNPKLLPHMFMTNGTSGTDFGTTATQTKVAVPSRVPGWSWFGKSGYQEASDTMTSSSQTYGWGKPIMTTQDPTDNVATISGSSTKMAIFRYTSFNELVGGFFNSGPRGFFFASSAAAAALTSTAPNPTGGVLPGGDTGARALDETIIATDTF